MASEPLPDDFFYDAKNYAREPPACELPASFAPLYHSFAFESHKRSNLHYLDDVRGEAVPGGACFDGGGAARAFFTVVPSRAARRAVQVPEHVQEVPLLEVAAVAARSSSVLSSSGLAHALTPLALW